MGTWLHTKRQHSILMHTTVVGATLVWARALQIRGCHYLIATFVCALGYLYFSVYEFEDMGLVTQCYLAIYSIHRSLLLSLKKRFRVFSGCLRISV